MIFVIVPLGKAAKDTLFWLIRVLVYIPASMAGGALVGALLGAVGWALYAVLPGLAGGWSLALVGAVALLYGLHQAHLIRLPAPERHWQVPNGWIRRWPLFGTAMFGAALGTGVMTFIPIASFYPVLAWELGTGSVLLGAALGATYGFWRGWPAILGGLLMVFGKHPLELNSWILERVPLWHRIAAFLSLTAGTFLLALLIKSL